MNKGMTTTFCVIEAETIRISRKISFLTLCEKAHTDSYIHERIAHPHELL